MCNAYRNRIPVDLFQHAFPGLKMPGGVPNLEPRDEIKITDTAPIIRWVDGAPQLEQVRWSWPGPSRAPVFNYRSEGRHFGSGRCLIPADGFYEFTAPEPPAPKSARKTRWLFTMTGEPWFCIAGKLGSLQDGTPAFTMLTVDPGPDVKPYHNRQIVVLGPDAWGTWLGDDEPERVLRPSAAGTLSVEQVQP